MHLSTDAMNASLMMDGIQYSYGCAEDAVNLECMFTCEWQSTSAFNSDAGIESQKIEWHKLDLRGDFAYCAAGNGGSGTEALAKESWWRLQIPAPSAARIVKRGPRSPVCFRL